MHFFIELMRQPAWIPAWVFALMVINLVSIAFWEEALAKVIFIVFMLSAMLMMGLYSRFGFEKILGLGHVFWIPLLAYVLFEIPVVEGSFGIYLVSWSALTVVSLIFDMVDVCKFFAAR